MRGSHVVGAQGLEPGLASTAPDVSPNPAPAPLVDAWVATLSLIVPVLGLVAGQAALVRRRYGAPPAVDQVDVTVAPTGGAPIGAMVVEIAAFGDSAMAGVGVHQLEDALPVQLAQRVADSTGRPVRVVGYARSGARTIDVLARQVPLVRRVPDVSVLVVGTNDVTGLTPPASLIRFSGALMDALESLGAPVVMSSLPEFRAMRLMPHPLMEAALGYGAVVDAVQRLAAADRPLVRLIDVRRALGSQFYDEGTMSADAFHPSAVGYGLIAEVLLPAVLSVLGSAQLGGSTDGHQPE
jgi:lysophospholipase L1-like esterase